METGPRQAGDAPAALEARARAFAERFRRSADVAPDALEPHLADSGPIAVSLEVDRIVEHPDEGDPRLSFDLSFASRSVFLACLMVPDEDPETGHIEHRALDPAGCEAPEDAAPYLASHRHAYALEACEGSCCTFEEGSAMHRHLFLRRVCLDDPAGAKPAIDRLELYWSF